MNCWEIKIKWSSDEDLPSKWNIEDYMYFDKKIRKKDIEYIIEQRFVNNYYGRSVRVYSYNISLIKEGEI